jgi:hypothetical protein
MIDIMLSAHPPSPFAFLKHSNCFDAVSGIYGFHNAGMRHPPFQKYFQTGLLLFAVNV